MGSDKELDLLRSLAAAFGRYERAIDRVNQEKAGDDKAAWEAMDAALDEARGAFYAWRRIRPPNIVRRKTRPAPPKTGRPPRLLTFAGKTQSIAAWADELGIERWALHSRLKRGWTIEDVLTRPVGRPRGATK